MEFARLKERRIKSFAAGVLALITLWPTASAIAQEQSVKPDPVKTAAALAPAQTGVRVRTVEDLQSEIRSRLLRPELRRGQVGIKVVS